MNEELARVINSQLSDAKDLVDVLKMLKSSSYLDNIEDDVVVESIIKDINYCIPDIRWCASDLEEMLEDLKYGKYTLFDERW